MTEPLDVSRIANRPIADLDLDTRVLERLGRLRVYTVGSLYSLLWSDSLRATRFVDDDFAVLEQKIRELAARNRRSGGHFVAPDLDAPLASLRESAEQVNDLAEQLAAFRETCGEIRQAYCQVSEELDEQCTVLAAALARVREGLTDLDAADGTMSTMLSSLDALSETAEAASKLHGGIEEQLSEIHDGLPRNEEATDEQDIDGLARGGASGPEEDAELRAVLLDIQRKLNLEAAEGSSVKATGSGNQQLSLGFLCLRSDVKAKINRRRVYTVAGLVACPEADIRERFDLSEEQLDYLLDKLERFGLALADTDIAPYEDDSGAGADSLLDIAQGIRAHLQGAEEEGVEVNDTPQEESPEEQDDSDDLDPDIWAGLIDDDDGIGEEEDHDEPTETPVPEYQAPRHEQRRFEPEPEPEESDDLSTGSSLGARVDEPPQLDAPGSLRFRRENMFD